jgi:hypothetical protein
MGTFRRLGMGVIGVVVWCGVVWGKGLGGRGVVVWEE